MNAAVIKHWGRHYNGARGKDFLSGVSRTPDTGACPRNVADRWCIKCARLGNVVSLLQSRAAACVPHPQ